MLNSVLYKGDSNAVERANQANQAKPTKEDPSEKALQALARRQRRLDGLQLFEKSKLKTYYSHSIEYFISSQTLFSLIIASKYDSLSILQHLIDYLALCSHFVIYSQSVQVDR